MLSESTIAAILKDIGAVGRTTYCIDVVVVEQGYAATEDGLRATIASLTTQVAELTQYARCMEQDSVECAALLEAVAPGYNPSLELQTQVQLQAARNTELEARVEALTQELADKDKAMSWYMRSALHITADLCVAAKRAVDTLRALKTAENKHVVTEVISQLQEALGTTSSEQEGNDDDN